MASKKTEGLTRGVALIKKSIEAARASGVIASPEPLAANILKKLRLPNEEKVSPAMKELLAFDASWLGWSFDDEEPEFEPMALDELVEEEFGEEQIANFGEAIEMLGEDCIQLPNEGETRHFLYIGSADDRGEYPVISLSTEGGAKVSGFVPFDVWVAQRLGGLEKSAGSVPAGYEAACQSLAESNGDGRVNFVSEEREVSEREDKDEDDEDEDEDEDEDKEEKDDE